MERYTTGLIILSGMGLLILLGGIIAARSRRGTERLPERVAKAPDRWYRWHPRSRPTRTTGFGHVVFLVSCVASMFVAFRFGVYSYLLWWYGPVRVWSDGLRAAGTPKGHPWIISNGDHIPNGGWFAFLVWLPVWMILCALLMVVLNRFSPWKLQAPLDDAACATRGRANVAGARALIILGAVILAMSFALLLVIGIRS